MRRQQAALPPKGKDGVKDQNSSRKAAKAQRDAKAKHFLCFATLAYSAALRETGLSGHG
jgi:hypothetical protein